MIRKVRLIKPADRHSSNCRNAQYDVIVIGGGPAGLTAALYLARSKRRILVLDAGQPRNAPSPTAHGVFSRDGVPPDRLLTDARQQLAQYSTVEFRPLEAERAEAGALGIVVWLNGGTELRARRLLLACGVRDELPTIEGLAVRWGKTVLHCTYCHGYEVTDRPLALYARGTQQQVLTQQPEHGHRRQHALNQGRRQAENSQPLTLPNQAMLEV